MAKYIDAEALVKTLTEEAAYRIEHSEERDFVVGITHGIIVARDIVRLAPAADVAPVRRGEWIHGCRNGPGTEFCYCSECSEDALKDKAGYTEFSDFCPSCGADMRKDVTR